MLVVMSGESAIKAQAGGDSVQILAEGIGSVLGPAMKELEGRIDGASRSQAVLASSIDRLATELDKLLEMTPMPLVSQPASRLSGIRKRVLSLTATLHAIQGRVTYMDRIISRNTDTQVPPLNH
eukprot:TRINITY_DN2802_c0_g1_i1.p1 TRINITY_DN2802_c0_g1~~TRINITY_DN2802_c0_g1_i1.p1  ORF type:complete len:124 (-),score=15.04 TRINITY_DN2802_c0_g1_i1:656-1027(-)